ncbi:uncharacterized protein [Pseudorasbora parva]|uniref:uncharacterized protein isoform X1 n=2 Tax=Pseudorasbora parva TaxID=51549 RepID=UPI00351F4CAA
MILAHIEYWSTSWSYTSYAAIGPVEDIREILRKSGGSSVISSLDRDKHLSLKEQRQMVRFLVSYLMERFGENPSAEIQKEMALALTAQFPCLKNNEGHGYESWYTPGRYRHPATGYLEERLRNVRKRVRAPHSQRRHSHTQIFLNSTSRPSFPLPEESESSLTEVHTMIEWLKNNRSPHSQVEEFIKRTAPHRAAWIRASGTKTVEEINREYPRLHDFPGMVLCVRGQCGSSSEKERIGEVGVPHQDDFR